MEWAGGAEELGGYVLLFLVLYHFTLIARVIPG